MKGGFKRSPVNLGFTIVEVMVFLAVSGFTFLIAASFINGKEAQAEYNTGMNQANLQVKTIINNVSNGNYALPNGASLSCSFAGGRPNVTEIAPQPNNVAMEGCTFVGTVLEPDYNNSPYQYYMFTVAGCQNYNGAGSSYQCSTNPSDPLPTNLEQEQPQVVSWLSGSKTWDNGVGLTKIYYVSGGNWDQLSALGFFGSFPSMNNSVMESGAEPVNLVYFNGSSANTAQDIVSLGSNGPNGRLMTNGYIVMCFQGSKGQKGSIDIGSSNGGQQLTTQPVLGQQVPSQC